MFPLTGPAIKLLGGPKPAIVLGIAAHCVRNLVMSYTQAYWLMLIVQVYVFFMSYFHVIMVVLNHFLQH